MASKQREPLKVSSEPAGGEGPTVQVRLPRSARADWRLLLLTVGFFLLGAALVFLKDDATARSRAYTDTPEFKVWGALTIGIIASLPAVWRTGHDLLARLGRIPPRALRSEVAFAVVGVVVIVAAAVLAGLYARGTGSPYYGGIERTGVVYVLAVTAAVPALIAMWECFRQLAHGGSTEPAEVNRLLRLRQCLLSALTALGLLVSAGVLATGAQRQAVLADPKFTSPFPSAYVLIWGLSFSALLVVCFLPAFLRLTRLANGTIDAIFPVLPPGSEGWQNRLQERKDLADLLQVTSGAKDAVTSAILVAGPLISSAFSMFLPGPPS